MDLGFAVLAAALALLKQPSCNFATSFAFQSLAFQSPVMSFLSISRLPFGRLQNLRAAFGILLDHSLAFQRPVMSFLRVSRLPFGPTQKLRCVLSHFGICHPKPGHLFSSCSKTAVWLPSKPSQRFEPLCAYSWAIALPSRARSCLFLAFRDCRLAAFKTIAAL